MSTWFFALACPFHFFQAGFAQRIISHSVFGLVYAPVHVIHQGQQPALAEMRTFEYGFLDPNAKPFEQFLHFCPTLVVNDVVTYQPEHGQRTPGQE
jgi:hypothetical protein